VADLARATRFYDAVLEPLGCVRTWTGEDGVEYGGKLALFQRDAARASAGFHLALTARDRDAVDRFHAPALAAGGEDEGAPGLRLHYGPGYYAAFIRDPDGHRIDAVFHDS